GTSALILANRKAKDFLQPHTVANILFVLTLLPKRCAQTIMPGARLVQAEGVSGNIGSRPIVSICGRDPPEFPIGGAGLKTQTNNHVEAI
ncbi:MAG: hypothetical protein ACKVX9_00555, partial [Blastocatellia bacterium]